MTNWTSRSMAAALAAFMLVTGCAAPKAEQPQQQQQSERYVSPQVEGSNARINLEEVQKAFFSSKGSDFNGWMGAFEKRVNEIYEGEGIVSIDANRANNRLVVTGFIDKNQEPGFQSGEEKLFSIEQTGEAANNQVPVKVANGDGATYYQGHHSLLDNPFLQAFLIMGLMNSWGGRYHTPPGSYGALRTHRTSYRNSPAFKVQSAQNKSFATRFKQKTASDELKSRRTFGTGAGTDPNAQKRRTFGGAPTTDATQNRERRTWGGRRPAANPGTGSSAGSSTRRSWGGRRRR